MIRFWVFLLVVSIAVVVACIYLAFVFGSGLWLIGAVFWCNVVAQLAFLIVEVRKHGYR